MPDKKEITGLIKERIRRGVSKTLIHDELAQSYDEADFINILKDYPEPQLKERYAYLNNILIFALVTITLIKLAAILSMGEGLGALGLAVILFIGVFVNVMVIIFLFSGRASAYMIAFGLTIFSLERALEGGIAILNSGDLFLTSLYLLNALGTVSILVLSAILFVKVHPGYRWRNKVT